MNGNGGPFRPSQPAQRSATTPSRRPDAATSVRTSSPEPAPVASSAPAPKKEPVKHAAVSEKKKKTQKTPKIVIIAASILFVGVLLAIFLFSKSGLPPVNGNRYQAVFFTNGQQYFGKLKALNNDYFQLTDVYYLKAQSTDKDTTQQTTQDTTAQLVKVSEEVHGPEDEMVVSKQQVLFYQNLTEDSRIVYYINQHKKNNQ